MEWLEEARRLARLVQENYTDTLPVENLHATAEDSSEAMVKVEPKRLTRKTKTAAIQKMSNQDNEDEYGDNPQVKSDIPSIRPSIHFYLFSFSEISKIENKNYRSRISLRLSTKLQL